MSAGPGADEPLVWLEGTGAADRRFLHADARGSVIAVSDAGGDVTDKNTTDPYGAPGAGNIGRFQYTGQIWLAEAKLYHYKARAYNPAIGRFMQTDPIGYADGMNMYAYVGNDPVNFVDPSGMCTGSRILQRGAVSDNNGRCSTGDYTAGAGSSSTFGKSGGGGHSGGSSSGYCNKTGCLVTATRTTSLGTLTVIGTVSSGSEFSGCAGNTDCIVVTATRTRRFSDGSRILLGNTGAEQAFTVDSSGIFPLGSDVYSEIEQQCDDGSSRTGLAINRNAFGGALGGHTHPRSVDGGRIDQLPGPRDGGLARATGTAYIISNRGAFRIDYLGGQFSASLIFGRPLNGTEQTAMSGLVEKWNQHGGGDGVQCRTVSR